MNDILRDYFYTGISFSSFFINEGVFLCMKIENSKNGISRLFNTLKLRKYLKEQKETDKCLIGNEKYLVYQNIIGLDNSSVLFSNNKKYIKLYRKMKNDKEALVYDKFDFSSLTVDNFESPIIFVLKNEKSKEKYKEVISMCKKVDFIYLDKIKEETERDIIFDAIKVKILQDEVEIYFIEEGMYANYVANCVFGLNKIAIIN